MKCENCSHAEMCKWINELEGRGCDFGEPCEDAISREAVYSILNEYHIGEEEIESAMDECQNLTVNGIISDVSLLPSVTQKSGKWITVTNGRGGHECSLCHVYAPSYQNGDEWLTNFCPNCGAKMESEDKE